jgi:hypothetical protein
VNRPNARPYWLGLALYALLIAAYVGLRFGWRWLDGDAASLMALSRNVYVEGTVSPASGTYDLGYGFPALNTFLAHLGGISLEALQIYVQPFLLALLVPVSYATFRALLGNTTFAALASLLLFLQPEFLFEAVRSSHAKFTWLLALGMLFALARSFQAAGRTRPLARWVALSYLLAYGLITFNVFFASSYILALAFAFLGGWLLAHWRRSAGGPEGRLRRLLYVALACSVLVFLFVFYLYPPALRLAGSFLTMVDRVSSFVLDVETGVNPYQYVQATWLSPALYLILSSLSWLVLGLSFVNWGHKAWALLRGQALPSEQLLLWLLYTGFAFLLALGVILDLTGALSANLQVRLFPHLMIVAIPLAAEALRDLVARARRGGGRAHRQAVALVAVAVLFFSAASLFKATNEPLLSNYWVFHAPGERAAVRWAGPHLGGPWVWLGLDGRLRALVTAYEDWEGLGLEDYAGVRVVFDSDLLLSDVMEMQAARRAIPLPDVRDYLQIYDNGGATLHHPRPQTPYQR